MLVLTRRVGETVVIGPDIVIEVLGKRGSQVRLGIHAPADIERSTASRRPRACTCMSNGCCGRWVCLRGKIPRA